MKNPTHAADDPRDRPDRTPQTFDLRDTPTGRQRAIKASRLGTLEEFQLILVLGT